MEARYQVFMMVKGRTTRLALTTPLSDAEALDSLRQSAEGHTAQGYVVKFTTDGRAFGATGETTSSFSFIDTAN